MKNCLYCKKLIANNSKICKYCGKSQDTNLKVAKPRSVFLTSLLIAFTITMIAYSSDINNPSFNDKLSKAILNIGIYGLLSSIVFWVWRVIVKNSNEPFSNASGCSSIILFFGYLLLFFLFINNGSININQLLNLNSQQSSLPAIEKQNFTPAARYCPIRGLHAPDWKIKFCETFDKNTSSILMFNKDSLGGGNYGSGTASIQNGEYYVEYVGKAHNRYLSGVVQRILIGSGKNFYLSIDGLMECKYKDCGWGIAFGGNNDNFYLFRISHQGWWKFEELKNNSWYTLIQWKQNNEIKWEGKNKIDILISGSSYSFFVNDTMLMKYSGSISPYDGRGC